MHISFIVKYRHRIFDNESVRERCREIFCAAAADLRIDIEEIGFDRDHVHLIADIGLRSVTEIAKTLKERSARFLLREFPLLKEVYFWGSGLWSPVVYFGSVGKDLEQLSSYVRNQGISGGANTFGL